jgi:thioredoxin
MMRKLFINGIVALTLLLGSCNSSQESNDKAAFDEQGKMTNSDVNLNSADKDLKPICLSTADFKSKVWDYDASPEQWDYKGELPCVVDFYADWCRPCKMVAPIMDDLADYYRGKVIFYKVNTDNEKELASVFQINSIPAILFSPKDGKPAMQPGALSREDYIKIIDEFILKIKSEKS